MYILNIAKAIKKMSVNEIKDFIFESYYKRIGFSMENSYYSMKHLKKRYTYKKDLLLLANKLIEKIPDPCNAKEHYQSFTRKKNTKSVKKSKIITYQPKIFENPNVVDIKYIITEHPKTSHKLPKTIKQAEKVDSNSPLYHDKKSENFLNEENVKITKQEHALKGFASTYNVEILNSFNPELQLKDTESTINSKLIGLLTQLKGFKFVTTLVFVFKKIDSEDKTKYENFYSSSTAEKIVNESETDDVFQSIYTTFITNIQKPLRKGSG